MAENFPIPLTLYNKPLQSRFTDKIFRHGYRENGSMEAYTRLKRKEKVIEHRRETAMKRIHNEFEEQSAKVQALQRLIAHRQREMAHVAMEKYSATYIQSIFRGFAARQLRKRVIAGRLLADWARFRIYLHERHVAIIKIQSLLAIKLISIRQRILSRKHRAATVIQQVLYPHYLRRKHIRYSIRTAITSKVVSHALLFGVARAKVRCCVLERSKWQIYHFMESAFLRKKRLAKLRRLGGKPIFFALAHIPNDSPASSDSTSSLTFQLNDTLAYIHNTAKRRNEQYAAKRIVRKDNKVDTTAAWKALNRASRRLSVRCDFPSTIPFVLTGKYRLKTFYDTVLLLLDLISIATDNPATIEAMRLSAAAGMMEKYNREQREKEQIGEVQAMNGTPPKIRRDRNRVVVAVKGLQPGGRNKRPAISKSTSRMGAGNYSPMLPSITAFAETHLDTKAPKRPLSAEPQSTTSSESVAAAPTITKPSKPSKPKPSYRRIVSAV